MVFFVPTYFQPAKAVASGETRSAIRELRVSRRVERANGPEGQQATKIRTN